MARRLTPRSEWERRRGEVQLAGMAREGESGPTLDRAFGARDYIGTRFDRLKESEEGPVLVADVIMVAGRATAIGLFEEAPNLLERFLRLPEGTAANVAAFAKRYGLLRLCLVHGCPVPHRGVIDEECLYRGTERVEHWRQWAQAFRAVLLIAAKLHRGQLGSAEDWAMLVGRERFDEKAGFLVPKIEDEGVAEVWFGRSIDWEWEMLVGYLNDWVQLADLRLKLNMGFGLELGLSGLGLFGVLVRQVVFAGARVEGFVVCAGCGTLLKPHGRQPSRGRRSWCRSPECRRVANRHAKRRQRAREAPN